MSDHQPTAGSDEGSGTALDAETRMRSDVVRLVDLERLEETVMDAVRENSRTVAVVGGRVDAMRDELSSYVMEHAQHHTSFAGDWERRFAGIAIDLAYKRGLIGFPRMVLEWTRQYLPTLATILGLGAVIIGFLTGQVDVGVGR